MKKRSLLIKINEKMRRFMNIPLVSERKMMKSQKILKNSLLKIKHRE